MVVKDIVKSLVVITSDYCDEAVDEAVRLASSRSFRTKVYLKYLEDTDPSMDIHLDVEGYDDKKKRAKEICEKQRRKIMNAGLYAEVLQPHFGMACEEILRAEKELGPDIIIIAAPEKSIYRRILHGTHFSEKAAKKSMTPTLIVKPSPARRYNGGLSRKVMQLIKQ